MRCNMASPQKENGFTAIANELLEVVARMPLAGRELNVVIFILRKTYGFNKKSDYISLSQFEQGTGIDRKSICRVLTKLISSKIIIKNGSFYGLNKDYSVWLVAPRPLGGSGKEATRVVARLPHTKDTITKDKQHTASRDLSTPLTGKEQATRLKSKHMSKFRAYDENNPPEEASIDADSGELKSNSTKGRNLEAQRVAQYFAKKAREYTGKPYINTGYAHVKKIMENNGISELDMTSIIDNWFADVPNEVIAINIYKALSPFAINKFLQEK